jgi:hypothetical protein
LLNYAVVLVSGNNKNIMAKLTKYNNYKSLKLISKSSETNDAKTFVQLPELEDFLNKLQQKLMKSRKIKNDKL